MRVSITKRKALVNSQTCFQWENAVFAQAGIETETAYKRGRAQGQNEGLWHYNYPKVGTRANGSQQFEESNRIFRVLAALTTVLAALRRMFGRGTANARA
jgi:hypothetical protein